MIHAKHLTQHISAGILDLCFLSASGSRVSTHLFVKLQQLSDRGKKKSVNRGAQSGLARHEDDKLNVNILLFVRHSDSTFAFLVSGLRTAHIL